MEKKELSPEVAKKIIARTTELAEELEAELAEVAGGASLGLAASMQNTLNTTLVSRGVTNPGSNQGWWVVALVTGKEGFDAKGIAGR